MVALTTEPPGSPDSPLLSLSLRSVSSSTSVGATTGRKTFRMLTVEVVHQISVLQRLKLLARARKLSHDDDDDDDNGEPLPASAPISLNTSAKMLEEPEELPRSVSEPADLALAARDRHLPNWFRSLSTSQKSEERARQQRNLRGLCQRWKDRTFPDTGANWRRESQKVASLSLCVCDDASDRGVYCKRHALRNLWKRFFATNPGEVRNLTPVPGSDPLRPEDVLFADASLFQPEGPSEGAPAVRAVLAQYECTEVELVHNFVDERAAVTFSEFVIHIGHGCCGSEGEPNEDKPKGKKHLRVCEVVQWDLSRYRAHPKLGQDMYSRERILRGREPALRKILIFGKGMSLVPRDSLPQPVGAGGGTLSEADLGATVTDYVKALLENDYKSIAAMLSENFRIAGFDGVKDRDSFVEWLKSLRSAGGCFERTIRDVVMDHKSKTAFLLLEVKCDQKKVNIVNVVQWDLHDAAIINIREYGLGYKYCKY